MLRRLLKDAVPSGIADLFVRAKGLLVLPFLAHQLGPAEYGAWSQVQVFVAMVSPILFLGTEGGFIRLAAGRDLKVQLGFLSGWLVFLLVSCALATGVVVLSSGRVEALLFQTEGRYRTLVLLGLASLIMLAVLNAARSWYYLILQPRKVAHLSAVQTSLGIAAVFATIAIGGGVVEFLLLNLLADGLTAAIVVAGFVRAYGIARPDYGVILPALRFGLPLVPAGFATWGLNMLDRLFLAEFRGVAEVGIYSLVYTVGVTAVALLVRPFRMLYPPMVAAQHAEGRHDELQQTFSHSAGAVLAVALPAIVGAHMVSRPLVALLAPPEFAAGSVLLAPVMAGYLLMVLSSYFENHLGLVYRQHWFTISTIAALAANVTFNFALIPPFGMAGAAGATVLSFGVQLLVSFTAAQRYFPVKLELAFPLRVLAASGVMGVILWVTGAFAHRADLGPALELAVQVPCGAAIYALLVPVFGIAPRDRVFGLIRRFAGRLRGKMPG